MFVYLVSISQCVIVGSIFDANQQNKTRLVNLFYSRDVITIAKLKTWTPCGEFATLSNDEIRVCAVFKKLQ